MVQNQDLPNVATSGNVFNRISKVEYVVGLN